MDYKEYRKLYKDLLTDDGLRRIEETIDEKAKTLKQINEFLNKYPGVVSKDRDPATPFFELSVKELYRRTLQTCIDIINDVSTILSQQAYMSQTTFRRKFFEIFSKSERRLYVGIMLIFLSFILYFVDSAA